MARITCCVGKVEPDEECHVPKVSMHTTRKIKSDTHSKFKYLILRTCVIRRILGRHLGT